MPPTLRTRRSTDSAPGPARLRRQAWVPGVLTLGQLGACAVGPGPEASLDSPLLLGLLLLGPFLLVAAAVWAAWRAARQDAHRDG